MESLVIKFEAACPCLWFVGHLENGKPYLQSSDLSDELWEEQAICGACYPLMEEFDTTCYDEGYYERDWDSEEHMKRFNQKMIDLWEFLREHLKGKYEVYIHGFFGDVNSDRADSKEPVL